MQARSAYPINNIRGRGTMITFDIQEPFTSRGLVQKLEDNGVIVGTCGVCSVRLRPPLIIGMREVDMFIEILKTSLKS